MMRTTVLALMCAAVSLCSAGDLAAQVHVHVNGGQSREVMDASGNGRCVDLVVGHGASIVVCNEFAGNAVIRLVRHPGGNAQNPADVRVEAGIAGQTCQTFDPIGDSVPQGTYDIWIDHDGNGVFTSCGTFTVQ